VIQPIGDLPAHEPAVVLAVMTRLHRTQAVAELSVVTIFGGEIGDPVTWADESCAPGDAAFGAVADDIRAHLGSGPVIMYNAHRVLGQLSRIFPHWHPDAVFDMQLLSRQFAATVDHGPAPLNPRPAHRPAPSQRTATASRALATAHHFLRVANARQPAAG
jgi:hypothetical protein